MSPRISPRIRRPGTPGNACSRTRPSALGISLDLRVGWKGSVSLTDPVGGAGRDGDRRARGQGSSATVYDVRGRPSAGCASGYAGREAGGQVAGLGICDGVSERGERMPGWSAVGRTRPAYAGIGASSRVPQKWWAGGGERGLAGSSSTWSSTAGLGSIWVNILCPSCPQGRWLSNGLFAGIRFSPC